MVYPEWKQYRKGTLPALHVGDLMSQRAAALIELLRMEYGLSDRRGWYDWGRVCERGKDTWVVSSGYKARILPKVLSPVRILAPLSPLFAGFHIDSPKFCLRNTIDPAKVIYNRPKV